MSDVVLPIPQLLDIHNEVWDELNPYVRKPGRWISSSLGYCPRRNVFERGGVKRAAFDSKTLRTFAWGRFLHTKVRNMLDDFGLLVNEEIELDDEELQTVGHGDAIIGGGPQDGVEATPFQHELQHALTDMFGSPPYPLIWQEYKSVNSKGMQRLYNEGKPYPHQAIQLATYYVLAHRNPEQVVSRDGLQLEMPEYWQLVCVGKDSWGVQTFGLTKTYIDQATERIDTLNDCWKDQKLPDCDCEPWMRNYCAFPDTDEDGKVTGCCPESLGEQVDWSV